MSTTEPVVLIVEDSDLFRAMLRRYLEGSGVQVIEANDGDVALVLLATKDVDLVVADLNMMRVGGLELLSAMRAHARASVRAAAFVLLTAEEPGTPAYALAHAAPVDEFLTKPVRPKALREVVKRLAFQKRAPAAAP